MGTRTSSGSVQAVRTYAILEAAGDRLVIPLGENESLDHWILKLTVAKMLLEQGCPIAEFELEKPMAIAGELLRADILVSSRDTPVWVECRNCPAEKLALIARNFCGRVVHVDDFWWASLNEIESQAESEYRLYFFFADERTHEPVSLIPGVENWQYDFHSAPSWGVLASPDDRTLVFLEHRNPDERPIEVWGFLWVSHARACGQTPYEIETVVNGEFVPLPRFLHDNWQPDYSSQTMDVLRRHKRSPDDTPLTSARRGTPKLGYLVELLLSWGFPPEGISIRRKIRVGSRNFIPYIIGEGRDVSIWIERTFMGSEKLRYVRDHFDGKIMVLPDQFEWSMLGCSPTWFVAGVEYWHTRDGILTGWGVKRTASNYLQVFQVPSNRWVPWFALDLLMGRELASDWDPPVRHYGV